MRLSGISPDEQLVEIVEIPDHPYYIASQFHPEFKSRPDHPHPLFAGLMKAAADRRAARAEPRTTPTGEHLTRRP